MFSLQKNLIFESEHLLKVFEICTSFFFLLPQIDSKIEDTLGQESVLDSINKRDTIYKLVQENMKKAHNKYKSPNKKSQTFKVGDKVLRLNIRSQQRKGGKMEKKLDRTIQYSSPCRKKRRSAIPNRFFPQS